MFYIRSSRCIHTLNWAALQAFIALLRSVPCWQSKIFLPSTWKRIPSKARTTPVDNPCGSAHNILCPATFEGISSTKILGIDPLVKKLFTFNVVKWIIVKLTSKIFRLKPGSVRCCGRYFKLPNNFICVFEGIHISRVTINNIIEFTWPVFQFFESTVFHVFLY